MSQHFSTVSKARCDGLGENGPQRFIYLNVWFPFGGNARAGFGAMTLLEEVCHWRWALRFQKPTSVPHPTPANQDVSS